MASRSDNLPRRFAKIYTAAITDVLDDMGLLRQTLPHAIQPLTPEMRMAGYAFPARGRAYRGKPADRDATLRRFLAMLGAVPAESVLVLAAFVEAYWSSIGWMPSPVKFGVGGLLWIAVWYWLWRGGRDAA